MLTRLKDQAAAFALCLGRPPRLPFSREALVLAAVRREPPSLPIRCIQRREPKVPSMSAGTYRSASSSGQCKPNPFGLISIRESFERGAPASPSASVGGKSEFAAVLQCNDDPPPSSVIVSRLRDRTARNRRCASLVGRSELLLSNLHE